MDFEANTFTLVARTAYARDLLQHRLNRSVGRILRDVFGQPVEVRYLLAEEWEGEQAARSRLSGSRPTTEELSSALGRASFDSADLSASNSSRTFVRTAGSRFILFLTPYDPKIGESERKTLLWVAV